MCRTDRFVLGESDDSSDVALLEVIRKVVILKCPAERQPFRSKEEFSSLVSRGLSHPIIVQPRSLH